MSVKQTQSGRYQVRWRDPAGRQRAKTFRTRRDAERFERAQLVAIDKGNWVDPAGGRLTVAGACDQWFHAREATWKPKTRAGYADVIRSRIVPALGSRQLKTLKPSDVQRWINTMSAEVSPYRVRAAHRVLSMALDSAVDDGLIPRNPAARMRLPARPKKQTTPLTPDDVEKVAQAMPVAMYGTVVRLLGTVGLRWGEAAGLQVHDVDFDARMIWIRRALSETGGHVEVVTTKTHRERQVPLPSRLAEELGKLCDDKDPDDWVFEGPRGGPLRHGNFSFRCWKPALKTAGVRDMKLHSLRDSAASLMISKGANVKVIQRVLGHASAAMTLDVYGHMFDADLDGLATLLDDD